MDKAIAEFLPFKSPGPDGIYPCLLKSGWDTLKGSIRNICISSLILGSVPYSWGVSNGAIIQKPGKESYSDPKAYRIINLSSVILKLMEKLILWYLTIDCNLGDRLSSNQFGFRRGHSTEAAVHSLVAKIEEALAHGNYALGVFLDIEGAFDNVSFDALDKALSNSPSHRLVNSWISAMVRNRIVIYTLGDCTTLRHIIRGCPQGGILSPFLWILVINDLLVAVNSLSDTMQAFADDLAILFRGIDISVTLASQAQRCLDHISSWCSKVGLRLSHVKTKVIVFTWRNLWTIRPLTLYGNPVEFSQSVKYLGITLDSRLNWGAHISAQCSKAKSIQMMCQRAMGSTWGLSPYLSHWIYTAITRPIVLYGALSWFTAIDRYNYNIKNLNQLQLLACRCISGSFKSAPLDTLEAILGITPISLFIKEQVVRSVIRLRAWGLWKDPTIKGRGTFITHNHAATQLLNSYSFSHLELDIIKPFSNLDVPFSVSITDPEEALTLDFSSVPSSIMVFTDGSKFPGHTGAGFIVFDYDTSSPFSSAISLNSDASVFQAELHAISSACVYLASVYDSQSLVTIFSDSQASLRALQAKVITSSTVLACIKALSALCHRVKSVSLVWVPAHVGIEGNELADGLAKEGAQSPFSGTPLPFALSRVKSILSSTSHASHISHWASAETSLIFKPVISSMLSKHIHLRSLSRRDCRSLTYVLTGHAPLYYFLHKIGREDFPICPCCNLERETSFHFFCHCPAFFNARAKYLGDRVVTRHSLASSISLSRFAAFIAATGRFTRGFFTGRPPD